MTNRELIEITLHRLGLKIGCCSQEIEKVPRSEMEKVVKMLEYGDTDVEVSVEGQKQIVEIFHVDDEVDLKLTRPEIYARTYGRIFNKDEEESQE